MTDTVASAGTVLPSQQVFYARCVADPELGLAIRHWNGGLRFEAVADGCAEVVGFSVSDGLISDKVPQPGPGVISVVGSTPLWQPLTEAVPAPFMQLSVLVNMGGDGLDSSATDPMLWWQYLPATERASELLRAPGGTRAPRRQERSASTSDSPVGGYIHIDLETAEGTFDHRIYYETAGQGIPLLLQHTAGSHSLQWRHLFEMPAITDHFQLIAYDLPFHGKSIPPVDQRWWEHEYKLEGALLRQIPVAIAATLDLEHPVFMGCSVGGLLALDLALHHADLFSAVISLEGGLHIGGNRDALTGFWHPQVSNQSKARLMEALCSPTSPEAYVKEVSQVYSAGWPPAFLGDLYYYMVDFDLTERATEIDTRQVAVHILSGAYDFSGSIAHGAAAHEAIAGSTHTIMPDMGHFPMQENPVAFAEYLQPVLDQITGHIANNSIVP